MSLAGVMASSLEKDKEPKPFPAGGISEFKFGLGMLNDIFTSSTQP